MMQTESSHAAGCGIRATGKGPAAPSLSGHLSTHQNSASNTKESFWRCNYSLLTTTARTQ
jgi:hypothetical protein